MSPPNKHEKLDEESEEDKALRKQHMKQGCVSAAKFIAIRLALIVAIILYAVAGGFIFQHLESANEKDSCTQRSKSYDPVENATIEKLFKIAQSFKSPGDVKFALAAFATQLSEFNANVLAIRYNGDNCTMLGEPDGPDQGWSFYGSLLFSTTIFTTVGYGNIAPKTVWGRLVSIAYALIGIPLMLLVLASIGEIMANVFRYTYLNVCCCGFMSKTPPQKPSHERSQKISGDNFNQGNFKNEMNLRQNVIDDYEDNNDDDDDDDLDKISVPVTVSLILVGSYVFLGALIFSTTEGWDWMPAAYFSFITISTCGFGDLIPGLKNMNSIEGQMKMIATAIYMTCGMAILSMAFNLMQEEVGNKVEWLGEKCKRKKTEEAAEPLVPASKFQQNQANIKN